MKHYTEEDLILYYYEDGPRRTDVRTHLDACEPCASAYRALAATLKLVATPEAPERGDQYGLEVWQRVRHRLPEQEMPWWSVWFRADRLALAGAFTVLLLAAFVAGRWWAAGNAPAPVVARVATPAAAAKTGSAWPRMTTASGSCSRRSPIISIDQERLLTDIMNTTAGGDISTEQRWAEDLIATSRLYRQEADDTGEHSVALVLDELERSLLEIVHTPSRATAAHLDEIRRRIGCGVAAVQGTRARQRAQAARASGHAAVARALDLQNKLRGKS